jgi:Icc-related predicted phosphoesterase
MSKILCIADQIDPLVYSNSARERFDDVDFVLCAGDLPLEYLEFIVTTLSKNVYFVFGNHDLIHYSLYNKHATPSPDQLASYTKPPDFRPGGGATHVGSHVIKIEGDLLIAGLGGSRRYNQGDNQYTDFQMKIRILKLLPRLLYNKIRYGRYLDILLTHAAPRGIGDRDDPCHRGFDCFLWFMRKFKPRYLIHGHIHLYDAATKREHQYEDTTIINVFSHYILETEKSAHDIA